MKRSNHTIIFIPGFKGSVLVNQKRDIIWPNFVKAQFNHIISLSNDLPEINITNPVQYESVDVVQSVAVVPQLIKRNIYAKSINVLQKSVSSTTEIILFHYDWRQDIAIIVEKLKNLIEQISRYKSGHIDIICHSMGGIITSRAMQIIRNSLVRQIFFISVPFRGALKSLLDLMHGSQFGLNKTLLSSKAMTSFSSIYYLLPRYPEAVLNYNLFDIETWKKFNLGYMTNQNNPLQIEFLENQLNKVEDFYKKLELEASISCKDTRLIFINNKNRLTPTKISFEPEINITLDKGDGTVPEISLQVPDYYKKDHYKTYHISKDHSLSFTSHELIEIILKHLL